MAVSAAGFASLDVNEPGGAPAIMGILNLTPDSFSDGGKFTTREAAIAQALRMAEEGAAIIDVGGESSRPGAGPISDDEQLARVLPVIEALRSALPTRTLLSIDTRSPVVAARALTAGAAIVNDISAGRSDGMFDVVARSGAAMVLMHMQGVPDTMQLNPTYSDVVGEIVAYLSQRAALAETYGIASTRILIDPGIGFGKTRQHNLTLLRALPRFVATGYPVLLGASRKRFMGAICRETGFTDLLGATCATTALGVAAGVKVFRVHDVRANRQAAEVAWAIRQTTGAG